MLDLTLAAATGSARAGAKALFACATLLIACWATACGGSPDAGTGVGDLTEDVPGAASAGSGGSPTPRTPSPSAAEAVEARDLRAGPNLLIVTLDTLRADRIGAYGHAAAQTPVLDRLAAEGVRFARVASPAPITLVAHGSLMTGRIPPRHGLRDNGNFLADDGAVTLAEVLRDAGYATGGFVGSFVLDRRFGIAQGFDTYTDFVGSTPDVGSELLLNVQRRGDEVVDDAIAWLEEQAEPFFAWVHLYDPHTPYEPPEPFASRFPERPYDGEIAYTDQQLGRLIRYLEGAGHADDTLLVVTADHGEGLGDHEETWHAFFVYDATIQVPLLLRAEGLPAGLVVEGQSGLVDLMPTALALLGVDDPEASRRDGRDLRALIAAPSAPGHAAYAESMVPLINFGWSELRALSAGGYKYIAAPRPELYDLRDDPAERRNLAQQQPDRVAAMAGQLDAMVGNDDVEAVVAGGSANDPETLERLRSLGYLAGSAATASIDRSVDPKDKIGVYEAFTADFEDATEAVRAGQWASAERQFLALDRIVPDQFIVQHYLGRIALGRGDAGSAVAYLERSLGLNPAFHAPSYIELAKAYRADGAPQRAIELLQEAVGFQPDSFALHFNLGYHLQAAGRHDEALASYERADELVPRYPQLLTNIASIHLARRQPDRALTALREALEAQPDDGRTWGNVGMILGGTGRFAEAEQAFRTATELLPDEAPLHFNLGLALMRQGKNAEAIESLRRALEIDPDMAPAREALRAIGG